MNIVFERKWSDCPDCPCCGAKLSAKEVLVTEADNYTHYVLYLELSSPCPPTTPLACSARGGAEAEAEGISSAHSALGNDGEAGACRLAECPWCRSWGEPGTQHYCLVTRTIRIR